MKWQHIISIIICCVFGVGIIAGTILHQQHEKIHRFSEQSTQEEHVPSALSEVESKKRQMAIDNINRLCQQDAGTVYSVYVNYLDGTDPILIHQETMRSASMIKVFILAKAMEDERDGILQGNQSVVLRQAMKVGGAGSLNGRPNGTKISVSELLRLMVTESDNTATNMMIDLVGMERINQYIHREGYADTVLQRKMMDEEAVHQGKENVTSVKDLGTWFTKVYCHECVGEVYDEQMLQLLLQQTDTDCLPNALPRSREIAHKTGELNGLYHDGGIIYSPQGDYILCILTEHQNSHNRALYTMQQIAIQIDKARS